MRELVRGEITTALSGASFIGNSVLRVVADAQAALAHLVMRYIDWLAKQLLPDTAEAEWLDRHGDIWLVNADGTTGRKAATYATGVATVTGTSGVVVPQGSQLASGASEIVYETTEPVTLGGGPVEVDVRALDPGAAGNLNPGDILSFQITLDGVDTTAIVVTMTGGVDTESDEHLRDRVLERIRQPPMGGAAYDYVHWAKAVPGVTRAWAAPEQGPGTITVRFLMDELRAEDDGWPNSTDIQTVHDYIDSVRPVTVMGTYVLAPIKEFIDITIINLVPNDDAVKAAIVENIQDMLFELASPGQTIYSSWITNAINDTPGVVSFSLTEYNDFVMPSLGHMAVLGTVLYD